MKKFLFVIISILFLVSFAEAGINDRFSNLDLKKNDPSGQPSNGRGWIYTKDDSGGTMRLYFENENGTVNLIGTKRMLSLPINDWWTTYSRITDSTLPRFEFRNDKWLNQVGITPAIVFNGGWSTWTSVEYSTDPDDSMVSPALIQFPVPSYYQSGGEWVLWVQHEIPNNANNAAAHTTPSPIRWDYEYYIQTDGGVWDVTPTKGTLVTQDATDRINQITLSSSSITAGSVVQLRVWPSAEGQPIGHEKTVKKLLDAAFLFE